MVEPDTEDVLVVTTDADAAACRSIGEQNSKAQVCACHGRSGAVRQDRVCTWWNSASRSGHCWKQVFEDILKGSL
jgi:hypothetical protein